MTRKEEEGGLNEVKKLLRLPRAAFWSDMVRARVKVLLQKITPGELRVPLALAEPDPLFCLLTLIEHTYIGKA